MADWFELLKAQVAAKGVVVVAKELGYRNHTGVSLALKSRYPGRTDALARNVLATYHTVECPHTGQTQHRSRCAEIVSRTAPTHNPLAMQHWRACQRCPHKPDPEGRKP